MIIIMDISAWYIYIFLYYLKGDDKITTLSRRRGAKHTYVFFASIYNVIMIAHKRFNWLFISREMYNVYGLAGINLNDLI